MLRSRLLALSCFFIAHESHAVDGVGIGEMFPFLEFALWAAIPAVPIFTVYGLFRPSDAVARQRVWRWFLSIWLLCVVSPYAYRATGAAFAAHLCRSDASTDVRDSSEQWLNTAEKAMRERASRPVLFEYQQNESIWLGVKRVTFLLVEPTSRTELMRSRAYFAANSVVPYGCAGNEVYWRTRERFARFATIQHQR